MVAFMHCVHFLHSCDTYTRIRFETSFSPGISYALNLKPFYGKRRVNFMCHSWMQSSSNCKMCEARSFIPYVKCMCLCTRIVIIFCVLSVRLSEWVLDSEKLNRRTDLCSLLLLLHICWSWFHSLWLWFKSLFVYSRKRMCMCVSLMESVDRLTSDFHKCHVLTFYKDILSLLFLFLLLLLRCCCCCYCCSTVTAMAVVSGFVIPCFSRWHKTVANEHNKWSHFGDMVVKWKPNDELYSKIRKIFEQKYT